MSAPLRILMVEDSPTDAKLLVHVLRQSMPLEFERVDTADAMRAALTSGGWDLVLSDWAMPKFSARGALDVLKASQLDLPFIIVSGTIGEETAVEAMRAGAHDFVLKDKLARLAPAIEREVRECREREVHRRSEAELKASEVRLRRLDESGIVGVTVSDVDGRIVDANDAYLKMIGYTRDDLLKGKLRWNALTPLEHQAIGFRAIEALLRVGTAPAWETESFRKDGSRIPLLIGLAMLEPPRCIAFIVDLTERNRAEAGRVKAEEALRKTEDQLRHSQKMEAVGRLAGGVAHDFNNVLSVILSYGELINERLRPSDPMRADVDEITKAATRAAKLTRQLLTFSRHDLVEPKVLDLHDVLTGMQNMLQRLLGADVELTCPLPTTRGRIKVDQSAIEQVIVNLVVNARDAMPTGGKLTIETSTVILDEDFALSHLPAASGPHLMLAVTDTGAGMDRETQRRIFEPFFTTKGLGKGTGLGLSMVFGIVQQSGGNIWVYSEVGRGTTFKVYLPLVEGEVEADLVRVPPPTLQGTETILLVEDDEQVRTIVLNILRRLGYRVLAAEHAGAALLICERHPDTIDLLLTDVVMPQMSGPELAKRLLATRPGMKVLCMSGYTDDSIVRHGVLDIGLHFIQKPITPASLSAKVRDVLDAAPAR